MDFQYSDKARDAGLSNLFLPHSHGPDRLCLSALARHRLEPHDKGGRS